LLSLPFALLLSNGCCAVLNVGGNEELRGSIEEPSVQDPASPGPHKWLTPPDPPAGEKDAVVLAQLHLAPHSPTPPHPPPTPHPGPPFRASLDPYLRATPKPISQGLLHANASAHSKTPSRTSGPPIPATFNTRSSHTWPRGSTWPGGAWIPVYSLHLIGLSVMEAGSRTLNAALRANSDWIRRVQSWRVASTMRW
jgi:hypothetical protein